MAVKIYFSLCKGTFVKEHNLIKKSSIIAVVGDLSENERNVYNTLLSQALPKMLTVESHKMDVKALCEESGLNPAISKKTIKGMLQNMQRTLVEHDLLKVNYSGKWLSMQIIGMVKIDDGVVEWEYPRKMRELLATGKIFIEGADGEIKEITIPYAIIDRTQKFKNNRHAGSLYEYCLHWLPQDRNFAESQWYELPELKQLFRGKDNKPLRYTKYSDFKTNVLNKAIKAINEKETIPFSVVLKGKKLGRSIGLVKFYVERTDPVEDKIINIDSPIEYLNDELKNTAGLHPKTIQGFIDLAVKHDKMADLLEKTTSLLKFYKKKRKTGSALTKLVTSSLNSHIAENWRQGSIFDITNPVKNEQGKPALYPKEEQLLESVEKCYAERGEDCKKRQQGYSPDTLCNLCFMTHKLPEAGTN